MGPLDGGGKKKDTQYPKSLSQGHHVKNSLPLQLLLCPPLLLSSSLLFFFNQAVWGCQVFWDEDSQPCEKLIPCGPSSLWRSSPWEHWWWLAGRWWSVEGGGMDGRMKGAWTEGHLTSRSSSADSNFLTLRPTPELIYSCIHTPILFLLSSQLFTHSLSIPKSRTFWWGSPPAHQTAGMKSREDLRCGGLVEWLLEDDSGSQKRKYSCCIVSRTSLAEALTPPHPSATPKSILPPQPLGFNRSSLVVLLCVKATIPTDSSWGPCQGMKDMIDNNEGKTRRSTELPGTASAAGTWTHKEIQSLRTERWENMAHKAFKEERGDTKTDAWLLCLQFSFPSSTTSLSEQSAIRNIDRLSQPF